MEKEEKRERRARRELEAPKLRSDIRKVQAENPFIT